MNETNERNDEGTMAGMTAMFMAATRARWNAPNPTLYANCGGMANIS